MHRGQAITAEGAADVCHTGPHALGLFGGIQHRALTLFLHQIDGVIGDAARKPAIGQAIEGAAGRVGRVLRHPGQRQRQAVHENGVAAAMAHHHRVRGADLVQIINRQRPAILHLGIVVEKAFHPETGRCFRGFGLQLVDDGGDGDEFHLERIAHQGFIQQDVADRVIVAIDEARHHAGALQIDHSRAGTGQAFYRIAAHRHDAPALDRHRRGGGQGIIHGDQPAIVQDRIGIPFMRGGTGGPIGPQRRGHGDCKQVAAIGVDGHRLVPPDRIVAPQIMKCKRQEKGRGWPPPTPPTSR